jgi:serine/threonine protein kinase
MEWIDGKTLLDRLKAEQFEISEAAHVCRSILDGIEAIHAEGLTHGDLHVENVVLEPAIPKPSKVKIIDINYDESKSLAILSSTSRDKHFIGDVEAVGYLIGQVFLHSKSNHSTLSAVLEPTRKAKTIGELRGCVDRLLTEGGKAPSVSELWTVPKSLPPLTINGFSLSGEAVQLLLEGSKNGEIMYCENMIGDSFHAGGKVLLNTENPRQIALWKDAIAQLEGDDFIESKGTSAGAEYYRVTTPGFNLADKIREILGLPH